MTPTLTILYDRCQEVGDCRLWTQGTNADGVPIISLSATQRARSVRPIAYRLIYGPVPPGKFVFATCGHRNCISGKCLRAGTKSEYMQNAKRFGAYGGPEVCAARARAARSVAPRLTMEKARQIRAQRAAGRLLREIAADYGVSIDVISKIANNRMWRELSANASIFNRAA